MADVLTYSDHVVPVHAHAQLSLFYGEVRVDYEHGEPKQITVTEKMRKPAQVLHWIKRMTRVRT